VNQAKAQLYYTFAAQSGDKGAQMALGYRDWTGIGALEDCGKALQWYEQASYQGEPHAIDMGLSILILLLCSHGNVSSWASFRRDTSSDSYSTVRPCGRRVWAWRQCRVYWDKCSESRHQGWHFPVGRRDMGRRPRILFCEYHHCIRVLRDLIQLGSSMPTAARRTLHTAWEKYSTREVSTIRRAGSPRAAKVSAGCLVISTAPDTTSRKSHGTSGRATHRIHSNTHPPHPKKRAFKSGTQRRAPRTLGGCI
jgi:hypothetical protein